MIKHKIYYKSLTALDADTQDIYNRYALIKMQCDGNTQKNGFVSKKEVERVAIANGQTKRSLVNKLSSLASNGFIEKDKWGYTLTSTKTINQKLKLSYKKINGKEHTPFKKVELPANQNVIELSRLYYLIQQIYSQYLFRSNVCASDNRNVKRPEKFELSIEKICVKGQYKNKMRVWRLINQLENVGLIAIIRGAKNGLRNDCNKYTLLPFYKANWNLIDVQRRPYSYKQQLKRITGLSVSAKKKLTTRMKNVVVYNNSQKLFYKCLELGLQDILVQKGHLAATYKSFGRRKGRKVSKSMLSELLIHTLNDAELRNIVFKLMSPDQINVFETEGHYFDTRLHTFARDRYTFFNCHKVELVNSGGNFNEYEDELLISSKLKSLEIKNKIYGYSSL